MKCNEMLLVTAPQIEGHAITEYKGIVVGVAILGANVYKDMFANIRDIVGSRSGSYEKELISARDMAFFELEQKALDTGANAVIGIDLDYEVLGQNGGVLMVSISGTAVTICKSE